MTRLQQRSGALPAGRDFLLVFALLAAGMVTMAFGLLALLGWVSGWLRLASFVSGFQPMAPTTAVLFLLYGAAICVRARLPLSGSSFRISLVAGWLGTLVALLLFVLFCLGIHCGAEHLGLNTAGTVYGAALGHMSPVTACCFLLASVSFLASLSASATRPWRATLALVSAGVIMETCLIFMLIYLFGIPLLYSGRFYPPAINTTFAFITLGLALMALARRPGGLFRKMPKNDSKPAFMFALIFFVLAAGIVIVGWFYYRNSERHFRAEVERQFSAIAELKVSELVEWRKERLGDGGILFKNVSLSALVRRFFAQPADADAQRQLQVWLDKYKVHFRYDEARLLDAQGVTRLSVPAGLPTVPTSVAKGISNALQSGQVLIQDFYRSERDQQVHLGILVPILDESDANRPLGVFFLRIDPTVYLYPFIKRWPTPSPTAETLLLRRDGNDVLYLNDLRHQTNTALALRLPLTRTEVPAVRAALGQTGIMIGVDYRGVPVLSFGRAVPDSPWLMIAKIDLTEVNTPMRERLLQIVVLIGILLFGSGAGVGLVWRKQQVKFFRDMAASAEVLRLAEREYHELFESASDALLLIASDTGQVIDANNKAGELYGYERDELLTRKSADLSENPEETSRRIHEAQSKPGQVFSLPMRLHRKKDGTVFPAEIITRSLIREGQPVLFVTCRDITERKQAEADWAQSRAAELNILEDVIAARDQVKQANTSLLSEIAERKKAEEELRQKMEELRASNDELEQFNRASVGRELRMIELKQEINELCRRLGEPPRHAMDQLQTNSVPGSGPGPAPPGEGGT